MEKYCRINFLEWFCIDRFELALVYRTCFFVMPIHLLYVNRVNQRLQLANEPHIPHRASYNLSPRRACAKTSESFAICNVRGLLVLEFGPDGRRLLFLPISGAKSPATHLEI